MQLYFMVHTISWSAMTYIAIYNDDSGLLWLNYNNDLTTRPK